MINRVDEMLSGAYIGAGVTSNVYRILDGGRYVAVKLFTKPTNTLEFQTEATITQRAAHENVCELLGVNASRRYLVLEYCSRGSLGGVLYGSIEITREMAYSFAKDICKALTHIHSVNIHHQDVKPDNILVTAGWMCKLCDFGNAMIVESPRDALSLGGVGTPAFSAPEVLLDDDIDERSEVYAYAITLWCILTREQPWKGYDNNSVYFNAVVAGERPPLERCVTYPNLMSIETPMQEILQACWRVHMAFRPYFSTVLTALEEIV